MRTGTGRADPGAAARRGGPAQWQREAEPAEAGGQGVTGSQVSGHESGHESGQSSGRISGRGTARGSGDPSPQGPPGPGTGGVAVIVVNYATAALTVAAVDSVLARRHGGRPVTVHVVDNASPGDDWAVLQAAYADRGWGDRVTLHRSADNLGFGRGNNLVLRVLGVLDGASPPAAPPGPDKLFLLNPDARLENEAIAILADVLDARPRVAAAGARLLAPGSPPLPVTGAFRFPSLVSEFSDALALGPVARRLAHRTVPLPPDLPSGPVDWVTGSAVMFRREALAAVGGFDPVFFLYYEEVELMHRLRRAGWEVWHVAEAQVLHEGGAATKMVGGLSADGGRLPDYWYDSWGAYFLRTAGRGRALLAALARMSGWGLQHGIAALRRRPSRAPPGFLDGFARRVLRPLAGRAPAPPRRGS